MVVLMGADVDILGVNYYVLVAPPEADERLVPEGGFVDDTSRMIMVEDCRNDESLDDPYRKINRRLIREVIRAFTLEGGGDECWVNWFAAHYEKIRDVIEYLFRKINYARERVEGGFEYNED